MPSVFCADADHCFAYPRKNLATSTTDFDVGLALQASPIGLLNALFLSLLYNDRCWDQQSAYTIDKLRSSQRAPTANAPGHRRLRMNCAFSCNSHECPLTTSGYGR